MSRLKQALYVCNDTDEIDVTPETLDELEAKGAALVLDWQTFAREYNPKEIYGAEYDDHYDTREPGDCND